ncbi:MAG: hypothetical protein Q7R78_02475 [bacterium]|nr:hypothetical protein [bacterium]
MAKIDRARIQKIIKIATISIFVFGISALAYFESSRLLTGPEIEFNAQNNSATSSSYIKISGVIKNAVITNMNGRPIFIEPTGEFEEIALLNKGVNKVEFYAKDRFGKEIHDTLTILRN